MQDTHDENPTVGMVKWGLRHYGWVIALCVLAFGLILPNLLTARAVDFEAQAQVGPAEKLRLPNLDALPNLGTEAFSNGAVADAVRESFDPMLDDSVEVIPQRTELIAGQDNIVFTIIGRGDDAEQARGAANAAAAAFTSELNKYTETVGAFSIKKLATNAEQPPPIVGGLSAYLLSALAGLVVGGAIVVALLSWRRPVVAVTTVEAVTGAPAFANLHLGPTAERMDGLPRLVERLRADGSPLVYLAGPPASAPERSRLATHLSSIMRRVRTVKAPPPVPGTNGGFPPGGTAWSDLAPVIVSDPTVVDLATRPSGSLTLLVVRAGSPRSAVRKAAQNYLDGGRVGVVLLQRGSARSRRPVHPTESREAGPQTDETWSPVATERRNATAAASSDDAGKTE